MTRIRLAAAKFLARLATRLAAVEPVVEERADDDQGPSRPVELGEHAKAMVREAMVERRQRELNNQAPELEGSLRARYKRAVP